MPRSETPTQNFFITCAASAHNLLRLDLPGGHLPHLQTNTSSQQTWPDLAIGLYDKLTGRGAEIIYEFQGLDISIPSSSDPTAHHANWKVNGIVKICPDYRSFLRVILWCTITDIR